MDTKLPSQVSTEVQPLSWGREAVGCSVLIQCLVSLLSLLTRTGPTVQNNPVLKHPPYSTAHSASLWCTAQWHERLSQHHVRHHWSPPNHPVLLDLMLYSYLFILILIFNIQDTRILLRHGASIFYLQIWACAGFFLGLLPPAYPGMLWYNIVQVSLLLCLEKKPTDFTFYNSILGFNAFFSATRYNQSWNTTNETK